MIDIAALLIGAGGGFIVGGFTGCGLMAVRHMRKLALVDADALRNRKAIRALAHRQGQYVQNTFGTPSEDDARQVGAEIYDMLDSLPKEAPNGRQL